MSVQHHPEVPCHCPTTSSSIPQVPGLLPTIPKLFLEWKELKDENFQRLFISATSFNDDLNERSRKLGFNYQLLILFLICVFYLFL